MAHKRKVFRPDRGMAESRGIAPGVAWLAGTPDMR